MRRTLGGLILAVGVVIEGGGLFGYVSTRRFLERAARGAGAVIRVDRETDEDGGASYRPVVRFSTAAGAEIEFRSRFASNPKLYARGDAVTVLYEPNAPDRAEIEGFWTLWHLPVLCGVIGSVFLAVGTYLRLARGKTTAVVEPE